MPRAIAFSIRQAIWLRFRSGEQVSAIARALDLSPRTVRHLLARFQQGGLDALAASYDSCGSATPKPDDSLVRAVLQMRRDHPTWGAEMIRSMLRRQRPDIAASLPTTRELQRWLARVELAPAPKGRRPQGDPRRAKRPHEVWQMDASELVPLRSPQKICWLRLIDECSGAVLGTRVFPPSALAPCAARRHPDRAPPGVHAVGASRPHSGGQRRAVGIAG
jgi:transposase